MSDKRFEKLAAKDRALREKRQAEAQAEETSGLSDHGTMLKIMAATFALLIVIAGLLLVTLTMDGETPLRERIRNSIYAGIGLDAASKNPDIRGFAPAPDGWRRRDYAGIRDGRIARGVIELAMLRIAEEPENRDAIIADLAERIEDDRLDSMSDAEQAVLGGPDAVAAGRMLRQFSGDMGTAAYTNGSEVFTLQVIRSGGGGRAEAFALNNFEKPRVLVGGLEFDDGAQNTGGSDNPLDGVSGVIILSRAVDDDTYFFVHGIGSLRTAERLISGTDFDRFTVPQAEE